MILLLGDIAREIFNKLVPLFLGIEGIKSAEKCQKNAQNPLKHGLSPFRYAN